MPSYHWRLLVIWWPGALIIKALNHILGRANIRIPWNMLLDAWWWSRGLVLAKVQIWERCWISWVSLFHTSQSSIYVNFKTQFMYNNVLHFLVTLRILVPALLGRTKIQIPWNMPLGAWVWSGDLVAWCWQKSNSGSADEFPGSNCFEHLNQNI